MKADKLMEMICRELEEIEGKGEMSPGDLDVLYKLIMAKEKLLRIEEIENDMGYSNAGEWNASGTYARNNMNAYGGGNSYASNRRGTHYTRGYYSRNNGVRYSRAEGKEMLRDRLQELMESGDIGQNERTILQNAMNQMV